MLFLVQELQFGKAWIEFFFRRADGHDASLKLPGPVVGKVLGFEGIPVDSVRAGGSKHPLSSPFESKKNRLIQWNRKVCLEAESLQTSGHAYFKVGVRPGLPIAALQNG